jgi:hypothetical protein
VSLVKYKLIGIYVVLVVFGGALFWFGLWSFMGSISFLGLPPWNSNVLVDVDELLMIVGSVLFVLALFWLKKYWSKM